MTVELLYLKGCPFRTAAWNLVRDVLNKERLCAAFIETPILNSEEATSHRFPGSPTLRVNGRDIEEAHGEQLPVGLACRTYWVEGSPQGVPPRQWLERALRASRVPEENSL